MVDTHKQQGVENQWLFVLRPNCSLSWRGALMFFLSLLTISSFIAVSLAAMGFWLVLPFAGLEMMALGAGLYLVVCRCYECEVICISNDSICIQKGRRFPRHQCTLGRVWAKVVLEPCPKAWYPSRLFIRSHGRAVEIGRFLHEDERRHLAMELSRTLRPA